MIRRLVESLRPREARPASVKVNLAKTLLQIAAFWSFFLWLVPTVIVALERAVGLHRFWFASEGWRIAGVCLFLVMGSVGFWCGMIFAIKGDGTPLPLDCTTRFLVLGPYRYVRNPMAITGLSQGAAVGLMLGSPGVLLYSLLGAIAWNYLARPWEEADMARRFGTPYQRYRAQVRCWLPRLRPYEAVDATPR